ncbi:MAG: hypothetical protein PWP53_4216, partial [Lacrimispora sp.]|nr:hypothetical protein [Lacrimispora sp.]
MKKNKIAIAVALCMAAVLTACGTPAKTETTKAAEAETTKAGTETTKAEAEAE